MSELKKLFGKRIATMRNSLNLTQLQFSEKIDLSPSALAEIETGTTFPRPDTIEKLKAAFGCEYMDLFNFGDDENINKACDEVSDSIKYLIKHNKQLIPALRDFLRMLKR